MRAFRLTSAQIPPSVMDIPVPEVLPHQVRIKIAACGLNFADILMAQGQYQERPALPFTMGLELAGTVDTLGEDVSTLSVGDKVAVFAGSGGLADYGCFDASQCIVMPPNMPATVGAGFQVAYGTSHLALNHRAKLQAGETLLVLGAAGGVGLTAVEIGKRMGATVIACARGHAKLEQARLAGADHLIDSDTDDLRNAVKALGGADVVYDPVGGDLFTAALRACNPEARIVTIGFASGDIPQIPANIILVKNITVIGFYWGGYLAFKPDIVRASIHALFDWYTNGDLKPHISHSLPLERCGEALELLRSRKSTGKVVVTL